MYYKKQDSLYEIGFINAITHKFCETCNRLRVTSDGYIKPCLHSKEEIRFKGHNQQELQAILKEAISNKPKQHTLDKEYTNQSKRSMNKIGG